MLISYVRRGTPSISTNIVVVANAKSTVLAPIIIGRPTSSVLPMHVDILHIDFYSDWQLTRLEKLAEHIKVVINIQIHNEDDLALLDKLSYLHIYNIYVCLRYVDNALHKRLVSMIDELPLLYLPQAHKKYLCQEPVNCSCIVFDDDCTYHCPYKLELCSLEESLERKCSSCNYLDAYEYEELEVLYA